MGHGSEPFPKRDPTNSHLIFLRSHPLQEAEWDRGMDVLGADGCVFDIFSPRIQMVSHGKNEITHVVLHSYVRSEMGNIILYSRN